jgi:hypothetical protein
LIIFIEDTIENMNEYREEFLKRLEKLPVNVLDHHLEATAAFCYNQLKWTSYEPLVVYLCSHHPLAGSVFSYSEIKSMDSLNSTEQ